MSTYITVSIGNTDNKLTQQEWHDFVDDMNDLMEASGKVHFFGGSPTYAKWQNVAWILEIPEIVDIHAVINRIKLIRSMWEQESAFVLIGDGVFL